MVFLHFSILVLMSDLPSCAITCASPAVIRNHMCIAFRMFIACASHVHHMCSILKLLKAVDFGVVLGLGWGTASVLFFWTRGILWGRWPEAGEKEQQFVDVWPEVSK